MSNLARLDTLISRETHEADFMGIIDRSVKPGSICADLGACRGDFTFLFAKHAGETGKVYAFDAFQGNVEYLRGIVVQHGLEKLVQVEHAAITDGATSEILLYAGRNLSCFEWNLVGHDVEGKTTSAHYKVPALALDTYFQGRNSPQIIKIDIEGSGAAALRGMKHLLQSAKPIVLMELHNEEERNALQLIAAYGYEFWNIADDVRIELSSAGWPFHIAAIPLT